jgi:hypothetical protein
LLNQRHLVVSPVTGTVISGPQRPALSTPPRVPGSARRTSTIDTARPDGSLGPLQIEGTARDLVTPSNGKARVASSARLRLDVDGLDRSLLEITTDPEEPAFAGLLGALVGPGFRAKVDALVPYSDRGASPLLMLLDDVPGAVLVSGYAQLHAGARPTRPVPDQFLDAQVDLCAGWAGDASMIQIIRTTGQNPTPLGPVAPELLDTTDPMGWHDRPAMAPRSTRRARRLDVIAPAVAGKPYRIDVHFRDSHTDGDGEETVIHEYGVAASLDAATGTLLTIAATAHVLPWQECPAAVASATRLTGVPITELRRLVRREFKGISTCTHLNDVLRLLADVEVLVGELAR